ncbi:MAG: hypothetical protein KAT00_04470, partial [Planctomycetes bacterium]|nr:hypothetical protein [Planctomycetota bacterium]
MKTKETFVSTIILAIAMVAMLSVTAQAVVLMDYDDGVVDGFHDAAVRDGDFTNITGSDPLNKDVSLFNQMPNWTQVELLNTWLPGQTNQASKPDLFSGVGSDRNALLSAPVTNTHAQSLDYIPSDGDTYYISYMWKDAWGWVDGSWTVNVILYTTGTDEVHTWATNVVVCESGLSQVNNGWQTETFTGTITVPPASVGKNLFVAFESPNQTTGFGRLDNLFVEILPKTPANIVSPEHRATAISFSGTQLEWTVDENWACDLYLGTDPCALDIQLVDYAGVEGAYSYDTGAIDPSTMYYWQVDAIDPNGDVRVPGTPWIFVTADPTPAIDADPDGQVVYAGEDAVYSIVAYNPGTGDTTGLTYQWYKYVDGVSD